MVLKRTKVSKQPEHRACFCNDIRSFTFAMIEIGVLVFRTNLMANIFVSFQCIPSLLPPKFSLSCEPYTYVTIDKFQNILYKQQSEKHRATKLLHGRLHPLLTVWNAKKKINISTTFRFKRLKLRGSENQLMSITF